MSAAAVSLDSLFHNSTRFYGLFIFSQTTNRAFAEINFKFYVNGGKNSKRVGNTVGKGEIAC